MTEAILKKKGINPPVLDVCDVEPVEGYENLRRQFYAMRSLLNCKNAYLHEFYKKDYELALEQTKANIVSLNSEREMNAQLTNENIALTERVAVLQDIVDDVIKGYQSLDNGRADDMIGSMNVFPASDIENIVKSMRASLLQLIPTK